VNMPSHVSFIRDLMKFLIIASPRFSFFAAFFFCCSHELQVALSDHAALEGVTRLKLLPSVHCAHFNADELLVRVLRPEVGHGLRLFDPRVPYNGVFEVVADDIEARLAVLKHRGGVLLDGLVHAIGLAGDLEGRVGLRVFGSIEDLVGVGRGAQAVDLNLGDVL